MKRNKIKNGWDAIPIEKKKFEKSKLSWVSQYEIKYIEEDNIFSKIIKFIISISLLFAFDRSSARKSKINTTVNYAYETLSSSKFKFIPSSVAFYLFLSTIPIFVIVISIVSVVNNEWGIFLKNDLLSLLIPGVENMFITIDLRASEIIFIIVFMVSSIWFATKGINKLRDSFAELYGFEDKQNFIIKRLKSILIIIVTSLYFSIIALAFTPLIMFFKEVSPNNIIFEVAFYLFSFIFILIFGYIGIGLLFKYISPIKLKWSYLNLGILTSLIPTAIFLLIFSTICKYLNYSKFGIIGSVIYIILFILYISYFLHAGIIINSSYYKTNVLKNIEVKKSLVPKKIIIMFKNVWHWIKYRRKN